MNETVDVSNQLSGATRLFPIIGDPITCVESPVRLTRMFAEHEHNDVCIPMHVTEDVLDVVMAGLSDTLNVEEFLSRCCKSSRHSPIAAMFL
jgi:shikimate dehydrogenase